MNVWLLRVDGRHNHKVQESARVKSKKVNVRSNFGAAYRDDDPQLVWRMACLWVFLKPTHLEIWNDEEIRQYTDAVYQGALDNELKDKCTVLDAAFTPDDVRYVKVARTSLVCGDDLENTIETAKKESVLAELNLFRAKLRGEESSFTNYRAAVKAATDRAASEAPTLKLALAAP